MLLTLSRCPQLRCPPFPVQDKARNRPLPHSNNKHPHSNRHLLHKVSNKPLRNKELGQASTDFSAKKHRIPSHREKECGAFCLLRDGKRKGMLARRKTMARSSDRLAFILWEAPLLNNKPLRLFLKTGRCHTKYATHIDLPAGCTSTFGGICDFHCAEQGSCPKFCACVGPDAHALANEAPSMPGKKKSPSHKSAKGFERRVFARANTFRDPIP